MVRKKQTRKKMGRPSKYDQQDFCEKLIKSATQGKVIAEFCADVGICKQTYYDWSKSRQDFADAIKKADALREAYWVNEGVKLMKGIYKGGSATPWIFIMKNCFSWTDKTESKISTVIDGIVFDDED